MKLVLKSQSFEFRYEVEDFAREYVTKERFCSIAPSNNGWVLWWWEVSA